MLIRDYKTHCNLEVQGKQPPEAALSPQGAGRWRFLGGPEITQGLHFCSSN